MNEAGGMGLSVSDDGTGTCEKFGGKRKEVGRGKIAIFCEMYGKAGNSGKFEVLILLSCRNSRLSQVGYRCVRTGRGAVFFRGKIGAINPAISYHLSP